LSVTLGGQPALNRYVVLNLPITSEYAHLLYPYSSALPTKIDIFPLYLYFKYIYMYMIFS